VNTWIYGQNSNHGCCAGNILGRQKMINISDNRTNLLPHPTNDLLINGEWVKIDREIIPLVHLFASTPDVKTQFSCHGSTKEELEKYQEVRQPYILFTSKNFEFLNRIAGIVHEMNAEVDETYRTKADKDFDWVCWMSISWFDEIRYFLEFDCQESMLEFTDRLNGENNV